MRKNEAGMKNYMALGAFTSILLATLTGAAEARPGGITITASSVILIGPHESGAIVKAGEDLAQDMAKVFGRKPTIARNPAQAGAVTIVIGNEFAGLPADRSHDRESFSIATGSARLAGREVRTVRLSGADMRGTIFAIYQFSQTYLGVDPMYFWTDRMPARRETISMPARSYRQYPAPVFRYRGFFINDEDLLTGWTPGEQSDHTGIALSTWNKIYETILRLKGNLVIPGTWPFAGEPQMRLASDRGLVLSQHHAEPLGVNFSRWPKDVPYDYSHHPEILERAWANAVHAYDKDQEILWTVGLRGLSDMPYADFDPSVKGDAIAQAHLISKAIADQVAIVRKERPNAEFIAQLWREGGDLMHSGALTFPKGVSPIWADTGYGDLQDKGSATSGQGAYLHVAMLNDHANQLSELVPAEQLFRELGRFQTAGATQLILLNTSDIRPVVMGARATMEAAWAGRAVGSATDYYRRFAAEEFGPKASEEVAAIYREYFAAPATNADLGKPDGDQYYHNLARQLMITSMTDYPTTKLLDQAPKWIPPRLLGSAFDPDKAVPDGKREIEACGEAQRRWDALWEHAQAAAAKIDPERRDYYQAQVLTMIAANRESNRMLLEVARAVLLLKQGQRDDSAGHIDQAVAALDRFRNEESKAEYGKWANWYRGDWVTGVPRTRSMLVSYAAWLRDPTAPIIPPVMWSNWEASYHIQHYQGQRTVDER